MSALHQDLPLFRTTDPETSRQVHPSSINSHRGILLSQYITAVEGLTDEEANLRAIGQGRNIRGYWKRCSDLRSSGLIVDIGMTRANYSGSQGMVCVLTALGMKVARALS